MAIERKEGKVLEIAAEIDAFLTGKKYSDEEKIAALKALASTIELRLGAEAFLLGMKATLSRLIN